MAKRKFSATSDPPNPILLALVSQFLSNHGFSSSLRIFNTERRKRPLRDGFQDTYGEKYTKEIPQLDEIFQKYMQSRPLESAKNANGTKAFSGVESSDEDSDSDESSASASDSDASSLKSDVEMANIPKHRGSVKSTDSSSDSSDSESEDEQSHKSKESSKADGQIPASTLPNLKRKADLSSESSDHSSDESSSSEDKPPATKKTKIEAATSEDNSSSSDSDSDSELEAAVKTKLPPSESEASSDVPSSDSSSDSDSSPASEEVTAPGKVVAAIPKLVEAASDSSATVTGETTFVPVSTKVVANVKKHLGARPTRLAELSANAMTKDFVSNNYVSYAYADRAYNDLSVTRGKGFTKEKNKKKRGSYRGGTIDTSGGKGFQFED